MTHQYLVEYYSTIKRNRLLIHATMWKNLRDNKMSERCQAQRVHESHFHEILEEVQPNNSDRNQISGGRGLGAGIER